WVDDVLDGDRLSSVERLAFVSRQTSILEDCYRGRVPCALEPCERLLTELILHDREPNSGLQVYLRNMLQVMDFDSRRRGRLISGIELNEYTCHLASAVTECIHYFIGHGQATPQDDRRYLAVAAAHMIHMLRDTFEDIRVGYFNIP